MLNPRSDDFSADNHRLSPRQAILPGAATQAPGETLETRIALYCNGSCAFTRNSGVYFVGVIAPSIFPVYFRGKSEISVGRL